MLVQITLDAPKLKRTKEAQGFAAELIEHITETFNDDNSIRQFWSAVPKKGEK